MKLMSYNLYWHTLELMCFILFNLHTHQNIWAIIYAHIHACVYLHNHTSMYDVILLQITGLWLMGNLSR